MKATALALAAAAALYVTAVPAHAQTLLSDNFNAENGGVGAAEYSGFALWTGANVDLLAPGYFFNLCQLAGAARRASTWKAAATAPSSRRRPTTSRRAS